MSLCGLRLKSRLEREELSVQLTRNAYEGLKLFRTEMRVTSAFRCACKLGSMTSLHIKDFLSFCEECKWCKTVESDDSDDDDSAVNSRDGPSSSSPLLFNASKGATDDDMVAQQLFLDQQRLEALYKRNQMLEKAARHGAVAALWNIRSPSDFDDHSKFQVDQTLGSGLQKRHIRSTVAMHNVLTALSSRETLSVDISPLSRHSVREAFTFCVQEGRDECTLTEFAKLLFLFAKHFFPDMEEEFGHVFALDRLWDQSIDFFVNEYSTPNVDHIRDRLPIALFPGMDVIHAQYGQVCRLSFSLVGGGSPVSLRDVVRWLEECSAFGVFEHLSPQDVECAFAVAIDCAMRTAGDLATSGGDTLTRSSGAPEGCLDEKGFVDLVAMLGYFAFKAETKAPTLAAKCEKFILFLSGWFVRRSGHELSEAIQEVPRGLPQIVSMTPMVVSCRQRQTVIMEGKLFPSGGVFVKFGHWVAMSSPLDPYTGTNTIIPPPMDPNRIEVNFSHIDDTTTCIVRRYREVRVSVSADGIHYQRFKSPKKFTFEVLETPVPVESYLPRLQRIFVHYASGGGSRPVDEYINKAEWVEFCRDYRLLPRLPPNEQENEALTEPYKVAMQCFEQYSVESRDKTKKEIEGVRSKTIRALSSHNFSRCVLNCIVSNGTSLSSGIAETLSTEQWIGRETIPDVPEAQLGAHQLKVRRAAKGTAMSRHPEGPGEQQNNSPRGGRIPLVEQDILTGADLETVVDLSNFPKGRWTNETDHSKMIFRFLTTGERDFIDDPNLRQAALSSLNYGKVSLKATEALEEESSDRRSSSPKGNRDPVAEAREKTRVAVAQALVINHRSNLNATARRAEDAKERSRRQLARMQEQLDNERAANMELQQKVQHAAKLSADEAPLLHNTGNGVLQAEKEALHRVFVYELEKRKLALVAQSLKEQNLRDIERNRVLKDMKDRLTDSDASFGRLQDVVIGQSETIDRQAEVLRMLKDRATILTADVMYYRTAHEKLLNVVSEDPAKVELIEAIKKEKATHEVNVETVIAEMRMEAKSDAKKAAANPNGIKELVKLQKQKSKARGGSDPEPLTPFELPSAPAMKVSLTAEEAEERTRAAVAEVEEVKNNEIKYLEDQLAALQEKLVEYGDDEDGGELDDDVPEMEGVEGGSSRGSSRRSRGASRSGRNKQVVEIDIQTDPVSVSDADENDPNAVAFGRFSNYFRHDAKLVEHRIAPGESFDSIAERYHIPVDHLLAANFIFPQTSRHDDPQKYQQEMQLTLLGIASKSLRVPVEDATCVSLPASGKQSREGTREGAMRQHKKPVEAEKSTSKVSTSEGKKPPLNPTSTVPSKSSRGATPQSRQRNSSSRGGDSTVRLLAEGGDDVTEPSFHGNHCDDDDRPLSHSSAKAKPKHRTPNSPVSGGMTAANTPTRAAPSPADRSSLLAADRSIDDSFDSSSLQATMVRDDELMATPREIMGLLSNDVDDDVADNADPLANIPHTMAVRRTYSFTPEEAKRKTVERVIAVEQRVEHATKQMQEAISDQVAALTHYSQLTPPANANELQPLPQLVGNNDSNIVPPGGRSTPPRPEILIGPEMADYVQIACAEAKSFQKSFAFDGLAHHDDQHYVAHSQLPAKVVKRRLARSDLNVSAASHRRSLSPESLYRSSDPEWLMVVAAPVREMVERTIPQGEDGLAMVVTERLFVKAIRHYGEAELLRRLLIVKEAQDYFQSCVQKYHVMRSHADQAALKHRAELEALDRGVPSRTATADQDAIRGEAALKKETVTVQEVTAQRREQEKSVLKERKLLTRQMREEIAASNAREKKQFNELVQLKRDMHSGIGVSHALSKPSHRLLAPLGMHSTLQGMKVSKGGNIDDDVREVNVSSVKRIAPSENASMMLAVLLQSPVKLAPLVTSKNAPPTTTIANGTGATKQPVAMSPPPGGFGRLPSLALDQIELVAKAEGLLQAKRVSPAPSPKL